MRMREVPSPSQRLTHAIKVARMIAHWTHALLLASIEDICGSHCARYLHPFDHMCGSMRLEIESAMLLQEFLVTGGTEGVPIALPVVPSPSVTVASVQQSMVAMSMPTVEECILDLVHWHTM
jgi:hypothetical protein